jgi:hypothetical protein
MDISKQIEAVNFSADWRVANPGKSVSDEIMDRRRRGEDYTEFAAKMELARKFLNEDIFDLKLIDFSSSWKDRNPGEYDFAVDGVRYHYSEAGGVERITRA